jgi:hypothetical protein
MAGGDRAWSTDRTSQVAGDFAFLVVEIVTQYCMLAEVRPL